MAESAVPETYKALLAGTPQTGPKVQEIPLQKPQGNQVVVKIEFAPINPSEIASMYDSYIAKHSSEYKLVGFEGSGTIVAVGTDLRVPHKVGDRVHVTGPGTMGQYLLIKSENCSPILNDLSFEQAACHFMNPGAVIYMGVLAEKGKHKAAIHTAGSSALGKMLIRYFKLKGIKLINIVRKDEYIEELKQEGADYVLNSQSSDFEERLKEIAEKEQATIAFDAISGDFTGKVLKSQPPGSICYVYGALGGRELNRVSIMDLFQEKRIAGLYSTGYVEEVKKSGEIGKFFTEISTHLPTIFKSHIHKVFKLDEINEALAYYKDNASKGKLLLRPN